jgi:hypothetical protein
MKFFIEINVNTEQRLLNYIVSENSFNVTPIFNETKFDLVVNTLNLTVNNDNNVVQVWGYCPRNSWIKSDCITPLYEKGKLKVETELSPGYSYRINNDREWPVYFNEQSGWVCIGDYTIIGEAVEFVDNCLSVVIDGAIVSLWLKPYFIY